mmetsp:Transcript_10178/g.11917  ORF Transcript_10178/g.11917 Transcript_10178/m.11917 type:complete len:451 (-) Transcript_10178:216-1568(-)|eukprot:CAMPEP_0197847884 /NCGR_PEP_ID=MMETSP1438-20131217/7400_1 /TAXON_ID=1461541 /ORGANISM="Pterosperma sp., Strain CCMP1384" /LENGTH=450 /DNA_ID=CAMNT_0043459947 /DNA_START=65 /DNA_END=1417 /DNA_ORIENTATION=+
METTKVGTPTKASAAAVTPEAGVGPSFKTVYGRVTHALWVVTLVAFGLSPLLFYEGKWAWLLNNLGKLLLTYACIGLPVFVCYFYDYSATPENYIYATLRVLALKVYYRLKYDYAGTCVLLAAMCVFDWKLQTVSPLLPWGVAVFLIDGVHRLGMFLHYLKNIDKIRKWYKHTSWGYLCSDDPKDWSLAINITLGYLMGYVCAFTAHLVVFTTPCVKFTNRYVDFAVGMSVFFTVVMSTMKFQDQYERVALMQGIKPKGYGKRFMNGIFECAFTEITDHNSFYLSHKALHKNSDMYHLTHYDHHNLLPTYLIQDSGLIEGLLYRLSFQLTIPICESTHAFGILGYMIHGCLRHHYCPLVYPKFMALFNHRTQFHHLLHHFAPEGNPYHFIGLFDTLDLDKDFKRLWREERILKKIRQTGEPGGGHETVQGSIGFFDSKGVPKSPKPVKAQ